MLTLPVLAWLVTDFKEVVAWDEEENIIFT